MKIFIVGGTSGMGLAVAKIYLSQGHEVAVCGRDLMKLDVLSSFSSLKTYALDIYDKKKLESAVEDFSQGGLDIMLISAGSYADDSLEAISYEESVAMLEVNIAGTVNALEVARKAMKNQNKGQIAIIASVSGLLDYPYATTYSKTKTAVICIADAYRKALKPFGIIITVIAPGYVNTKKLQDLNAGDLSKKPFLVEEDEAAKQIVEGIALGKALVVFPQKMKKLIQFLSILPSCLVRFIMYQKAKWYHKK